MKSKLIPVVLTAALTSVLTFFVAAHFNRAVPYFGQAISRSLPVNYAAFDNSKTMTNAPVANFEQAAASSVKAVVHVKSTVKARTVRSSDMNDLYSQLFGPRQYMIPSQVESGSGVIISPDGYIVTNNHVVAGGDEVTVTFNDRYTAQAKVVATDPSFDIALLKVDGEKELPYMEFGNSDDVKLGQWVMAVGYPFSLDATVTAGIVSAKGRSIGINKQQSDAAIESFIQTDAAVNPGNSGGALVNTAGQLVGINSAIASPTGSYAGYSYAIPSNIVRKVVNDMVKYGKVQRGYLGISYVDNKSVTSDQLKQLGLDKTEGVYVTGILDNSGAALAGLQKGDIITSINGQPVSTTPQLQEQVARYQPGDNLNVAFVRNGKAMTTNVKLSKNISMPRMLGAELRPLTQKEMSQYDVDGGLVVEDLGNGLLAKQTRMHKGFVILGVNDDRVRTLQEFEQALSSSKQVQISGFQPGYQGMYYYNLNNVSGPGDQQ